MTSPPATFEAPSRRAAGRLPVTLVTGFLGSGKTTLVNHILSNRQDVRAAVLVNELGDIGIDNDLIVATEDGMIELNNGCICCSTNNDLVDSIVRVLGRPEPVDHIIVETTGVADPLPVALTFQRPEFRDTLRLDAIVAVADAEQFSLDLFDGIAPRNQLRHADAILLNKCDRAGAERLATVEEKIRSLNAEARLVRTTQSAVPLALILDVDLFRPRHAEHDHAHLHDDGFVSLSFESESPFSVRRLQSFLDSGRPPGLFRAKGFLWLAETGKRYVFHLVGERFTLEEDDRGVAGTNRLVLIGQNLDVETLRVRLANCLAGD
ncbi:MAG: CobW family GTP-binding protein [Reyranella sp.]